MWKSGSLVSLSNSKANIILLVESKGKNVLSFALPHKPYSRLFLNQSGILTFCSDVADRGCLFVIERHGDLIYVLKSYQNNSFYLDINDAGLLEAKNDNVSHFIRIITLTENPTFQLNIAQNVSVMLKKWQTHRFIVEGYLHLSNIVDMHVINKCNIILNNALGTPNALIKGGTQGINVGKFDGNLILLLLF
jgi:hypothetical protein